MVRCASGVLVAFYVLVVPAKADTFEELAAQADAAREADLIPRAIQLYRQALGVRPVWAEGWWWLGTLFYDTDQYSDGRQAFAQFVKLDEKSALGWAFLGLCEFETGAYEPALEHMERSLAAGAGLELKTQQVLYLHEALLLTRAGLFERARRLFGPLMRRGIQDPTLITGIGLNVLGLRMLPNEVPADRQDLAAAAGRAAYSWMAGDLGKAGVEIRELVTAYPNAPGVHYFNAMFLSASHPDEAMAAFRRELEANPRNADARAMIALLLVTDNQPSVAIPFARKAAEEQPASPLTQYAYGAALSAAGDLRQAIEHLQTAERLDPSNLDNHIALAGAYARSGRHAEARRERQTSIDLAKGSGARE